MNYLSTGLSALLALTLFTLTGCASSPSADCKAGIKVTCTKIHECTADKSTDADADGTADFEEMFGADAAACETMMNDGYTADLGGTTITVTGAKCDDVTKDNVCPTETPNYDAGAAKDCKDAYDKQTCEDFNSPSPTTPAACNNVCTA